MPSRAPIRGAYPIPQRTGLSGGAWAAIGAAVVLVVGGIVALVLVLGHTSPTATATDQSGFGTQSTGSTGTGTGNTGDENSGSDNSGSGNSGSGNSGSGNSGGGGSGQEPATSASPTGDWTQYSDASTGFTIWYPTGWTIDQIPGGDQTSGGVYFREPGVNAYLLAAYISPPGPSALGGWQQQEQNANFLSAHPDYQRVSMTGDDQQATWEYTYTAYVTGMHGIDWADVPDNGQYGFALNWVTDDADWSGLQTTFQAMQQSFVPGG